MLPNAYLSLSSVNVEEALVELELLVQLPIGVFPDQSTLTSPPRTRHPHDPGASCAQTTGAEEEEAWGRVGE